MGLNHPIKYKYIILFACLFYTLTACKESPVKSTGRKASQEKTLHQVSSNIERLTAVDSSSQTPKSSGIATDSRTLYISLQDERPQNILPIQFVDAQRNIPSQFPSQETQRTIQVRISIRGFAKSQLESVENRVFNLISAHAPQPWLLRKSSSVDKNESIWGTLNIDLQRTSIRMRRTSKTAPIRAKYQFRFQMSLGMDKSMKSNWNGFETLFQDEVPITNEHAVDAQFWKKLEDGFPLLTVNDPDETRQWLRAQGLMPQILDNSLSSMRFPLHSYHPQGCVMFRDTDGESGGRQTLKSLYSPYALPQMVTITPISISCTRDATFLVAAESASKLALYYQPIGAAHAWKSTLTFEDTVKPGSLDVYIDDRVICLYTGNPTGQTRSMEIQCLDRKSGLVKWKTSHLAGFRRGFARNEETLVFANDQAVISFSRDGAIRSYIPIQTSGKPRPETSCQLQNRLIFMTSSGQFVSWNMDSQEFDWQTQALDPRFVHCSQHHTFLYSEVGGYLLAFDVEKNQPLWKYRLSTIPRDAMTYGDVIYLLTDRAIVTLDRSTGKPRAQIPLPWMATRFISLGAHIYLDTDDAIYTWK